MHNTAIMREIVTRTNVVMVERIFGDPGVTSLLTIFEILWDLYRHIEPSRTNNKIIVFCPIETIGQLLPASDGAAILDFATAQSTLPNTLVIEARNAGNIYLHASSDFDIESTKQTAVVYEYQARQEQFWAGPECSRVTRIDPSADSQFAVPTFFTLRQALLSYAAEQIKHSSCPLFSEAWNCPNRIFFKNGPEVYMRKSLMYFLKIRLGAGYEVRPEQIMDETHPVDLKVTYSPGRRLMIIEIKWLGDSINPTTGRITQYRDARAKSGADQLVGYIEQNITQAPTHVTQAYYVIIDARRAGLTNSTQAITRTQGYHYSQTEISFDTEHHRIRNDFDPPYRMFAEPICTAMDSGAAT